MEFLIRIIDHICVLMILGQKIQKPIRHIQNRKKNMNKIIQNSLQKVLYYVLIKIVVHEFMIVMKVNVQVGPNFIVLWEIVLKIQEIVKT